MKESNVVLLLAAIEIIVFIKHFGDMSAMLGTGFMIVAFVAYAIHLKIIEKSNVETHTI